MFLLLIANNHFDVLQTKSHKYHTMILLLCDTSGQCAIILRFGEPTQGFRCNIIVTLEATGLVENLSLFSPCSSYNNTTLSAVQTASLQLFGAQAMHATLETRASCYTKERMPKTQELFTS